MRKLKAEVLLESLKQIDDPRREHQKFQSLFDILVIFICATICRAEHWTKMEEFGTKGADYVISLKGNQGLLHKEIKDYLDWAERVKFQGISFD